MSNSEKNLTKSEILKILAKEGGRVHFCGVGGVSMSALMRLSEHFGILTSGSDRERGKYFDDLIKDGFDVLIGSRDSFTAKTVLLVYSHAVMENDPELLLASRLGIPKVSRAQYLGALMTCYERRIGVSGSHGKSTVTAMIYSIFKENDSEPTVLSGAMLPEDSKCYAFGTLDRLIYEACEYKDSFLSFSPSLGVFLNLELDHVDYFKSLDAISLSFEAAMRLSEKVVMNFDDLNLTRLIPKLTNRPVGYGFSANADYRIEGVLRKGDLICFNLLKDEKLLGEVKLPMLGDFNVMNAAAAIAATMEEGVEFEICRRALSRFHGIGRRLEYIGCYKGRAVYYDYAHHPTEIIESVKAIREMHGAVTVIFKPHTYSRTKGLWSDFKVALGEADHTLILDVSAVRENIIVGVSSEALADECGARYVGNCREMLSELEKTHGAIILMGAADLEKEKSALSKFFC